MRLLVPFALSLASVALVAPRTGAPVPSPRPANSAAPLAPRVRVERLADGLYALIRREPLGLAVNSNSLVVIGDDGVLVVDAQFTSEATLEHLAAIRALTRLPIRWVVNTHWHDDHVAGTQVYRDSCPGVQVITTRSTREDLVSLGRPNRDGTRTGAPPLVDRFQRLLDMGLGIDSTPVSPAERASVESALRIMRRYLAELPFFREELADTVVDRRLTIHSGRRTIDLRWFGRANTRGDLVIWLPRERVVATGDLLVAPVPFAFNSYPGEWVAVLDSVAALQPAVLVPGHGPVMRDLDYLRTVRSLLATAVDSARAAQVRGLTLEETLRTIRLDSVRIALVGDEKWGSSMFHRFFRIPTLSRAFEQARSGPPR